MKKLMEIKTFKGTFEKQYVMTNKKMLILLCILSLLVLLGFLIYLIV
jgi:hypothetical protein